MVEKGIERSKSLQSQAFDHLMNEIMMGRLPFGSLLSEKTLAAELHTSKTPVREALVQLQSLGLLDTKPQRGWVVFLPTIKQIEELCEVRIVLEVAAMRASLTQDKARFVSALRKVHERTAKNVKSHPLNIYQFLDDEFHLEFFRNCNNETLLSAYEMFRPRIHTLRVNMQDQNPHLIKQSVQDHADIIQRVVADQPDQAADTIARHIRRMSAAYAAHWNVLMCREDEIEKY